MENEEFDETVMYTMDMFGNIISDDHDLKDLEMLDETIEMNALHAQDDAFLKNNDLSWDFYSLNDASHWITKIDV